MAAPAKSNGMTIALIVAIAAFLVAAVAAFIFYRNDSQQQARYAEQADQMAGLKAANARAEEEKELLKQRIGVTEGEVGLDNPEQPDTVLGKVAGLLKDEGTGRSESDLKTLVGNLNSDLSAARVSQAESAATVEQLKAEIEALREQFTSMAKVSEDGRQAAERDVADVQADKAETVAAREKTIAEQRDQLRELQSELEQERTRLNTRIAQLQDERDDLVAINTTINERIRGLEDQSYVRPDGQLVQVEPTTNKAWIDLGKEDAVRVGTTFSVYDKDTVGSQGGRKEDIKGKIEVLEVVGPHLSEVRILDQDLDNPFSRFDPIFTPLWSRGQSIQFAFVGNIDLDGDGVGTEAERNRLHRIIRDNEAQISIEVNNEGVRTDGAGNRLVDDQGVPTRTLDQNTAMLVVGVLPDPTQEVGEKNKREATAIQEAHAALKNEARRNNIEVRNLGHFLDTVGYVPKRKLFRPGDDPRFNQKVDARDADYDPRVDPNARVSGRFTERQKYQRERGTNGRFGDPGDQ